MITRNTILNGLLDSKNTGLYNFVSKSISLSVEQTASPDYGVFTKGDRAIIYVPKGKPVPSAFAHELLHIEINVRGVYFSLKNSVQERPLLLPVFPEVLCDYIACVLEHKKMFPRFLSMGYDEAEFLSDSLSPVLTLNEVDSLIRGIKYEGRYNAKGIELFIGKFLGAKCSCFSFFDYSSELQALRVAEPDLTSILDHLVDRWDKYDIEKEGDFLADSHFLISFDFLEEIEEWMKRIHMS